MGYTKLAAKKDSKTSKPTNTFLTGIMSFSKIFFRCLQADGNISNMRIYKYQTGFKTLFQKFLVVNLDEAEEDLDNI